MVFPSFILSEANRLKTINRPASHYGLSLILGGAEATLWDVTNAYAYMGRSLLQLPQTECSLLLADAEGSGESEVFASGNRRILSNREPHGKPSMR